jgi:hypothetical protein
MLLAGARLFGTRRLRSALANLMDGKTISETARARPQKDCPTASHGSRGFFILGCTQANSELLLPANLRRENIVSVL